MVENPFVLEYDDLFNKFPLEERIYRFRCVEAWSMVVPWNGFELADLLEMAGVQDGAKYVAFETVLRKDEMPGTRFPVLDSPYVAGLRLDEAMKAYEQVLSADPTQEAPSDPVSVSRALFSITPGFSSPGRGSGSA